MLEHVERWLVVALGTSGNLVANAIEEYSRGHRAFPVAAYHRLGSSRMPPDLPPGGRPPRVYKRYIATAGLGKHLDSGAKAYDLQRNAIREDLMSIRDAHPAIRNVLLISSPEGGTAGVYLDKKTGDRKDYRLLGDFLNFVDARRIWLLALVPGPFYGDKVIESNALLSLHRIRDFAHSGRKQWPPLQ